MSCIPSTYNASGELVGCTEQELHSIISTQLYTLFALGTGLYIYKTLTAENWADVAVQIGWGCVSAFTHTKRFTVRHVIPGVFTTGAFLAKCFASARRDPETDVDGEDEDDDDDHCYVRVVKDGVELHSHSSIFALIQHLTEHVQQEQEQAEAEAEADADADADAEAESDDEEQEQEQDSDDVIDVHLHAQTQNEADDILTAKDESKSESNSESDSDSESESESETSHKDENFIADELALIKNHSMKFDFVMCQVPTMQSATSDNPMCMHVIKYDGFPCESDGSYFFFRKFAPVNHRMLEIVLQCDGSEYALDLSSPDNFYVVGNKLLDPAFLKWFMCKNHGVNINFGAACNYAIKCIDHNAELHALQSCNYLRVTESGFEIHDSGLI
jgi:hypothetical protein